MGATKRTAAACFLEVLQLKTWGLLRVTQKEAYDQIKIYATVREKTMNLDSCVMGVAGGTTGDRPLRWCGGRDNECKIGRFVYRSHGSIII